MVLSPIKLKLHVLGDPVLRKKAALVKEVGPSERLLIASMVEAMREFKGIGLAAPQVGIDLQIFVVDIGMGPFAVVNPHIIKRSGSGFMDEGCLSVPGFAVKVKRPETIHVRYTNENNQVVERELTELLARVFQHEYDHLMGKLIVDYAGWRKRRIINQHFTQGQGEATVI